MRISLFKTPAHRVFNYIPRYYDPKKEKRHESEQDSDYVPGKNIRSGGMRRSIVDYRKTANKNQRIRTIIILFSIGILFIIAYLVVKYFTLLWPT